MKAAYGVPDPRPARGRTTAGRRGRCSAESRQRALLAILLTRANQVVSPRRPDRRSCSARSPVRLRPRTFVQVYVSRLRKALEPDRERRRPGREWVRHAVRPATSSASSADELDLERFERLAEEGRQRTRSAATPETARDARCVEALALWRGPALADFAYEPFAQRREPAASRSSGSPRSRTASTRTCCSARHAELVTELRDSRCARTSCAKGSAGSSCSRSTAPGARPRRSTCIPGHTPCAERRARARARPPRCSSSSGRFSARIRLSALPPPPGRFRPRAVRSCCCRWRPKRRPGSSRSRSR